jgi:hypothetical protein
MMQQLAFMKFWLFFLIPPALILVAVLAGKVVQFSHAALFGDSKEDNG